MKWTRRELAALLGAGVLVSARLWETGEGTQWNGEGRQETENAKAPLAHCVRSYP